MIKFEKTSHCVSRQHCVACRTDADWRQSLVNAGLVETRDFECKWGVTKLTASTVQRDALIALATTQEQLKAIAKNDRQAKGTCCGQKKESD